MAEKRARVVEEVVVGKESHERTVKKASSETVRIRKAQIRVERKKD